MAEAKDILLDEQNRLRIEDGDFVVGPSDGQHAKLLLMSDKGGWRQWPLLGVGLRRALNAKLTPGMLLSLRKEIYSQFASDNVRIKELVITPTQFKLQSERI